MSEELKRDGAGQATGWENMDSASKVNTESKPKGDHHEEQDVPMTFDIDETGFSAVSELSKITGVDEAILHRASTALVLAKKILWALK